jgi:hypothetical protein
MNKKMLRHISLALSSLVLALLFSSPAFGAATIIILNNDAAGVGFNDATPVAPVGGNAGTTLGQQRLIAFQAAANKWGATLSSPVTITIRAQWTALSCTATQAVLGSAGAIQIWRDFAGVPFSSTWYNESLTGRLVGFDPDVATPEINANFNINLGNAGCLTGTFFYLGLDNNHGSNIDLVTVLTHEFGHGLGFQTFTNASTGAQNSGFPSIFDRFLMDLGSGKSWLQMTNAERVTSALDTHKLAWNGPQVQTDVPGVLSLGIPVLKITSPPALAGNYDAGTAAYGPALTAGGVSGTLLLANDGTAPTSDGCEAFPANFFNGNIAVIDRGTCSFKTKTLNAQNAGATATIIVNNVAGSPAPGLGDDATIVTPITIPTISLTQSDGQLIEAQLGSGVTGTVQSDTTVRAGADPFGKALMYSPNPFQAGSSVSHWDTIAFPNLLMEPAINPDLTHEVTPPNDLTFSQMVDIGWVASALPSSISKTLGDNQNAALNQPFLIPPTVTVSPAVSGITVTWTVNPASGAGATFPSTSSRFAVSTTDALGVAVAPTLTANSTPGLYSMNATAPGAGTTTFTLLNDAVPVPGSTCLTDTTQGDFLAGAFNNTDANASPGDVILLNPASSDQTQVVASTSGTGFNTTQWLGQTFVPGVTGNLAKIDMALFCASCSGTDQPITVEIRTTAGSPALPTSTVLATTTIAGFNSGASTLLTANFAAPPALTAGTTYAYTLRLVTNRTGTYAAVFGNGPTDYPTGDRVLSTTSGASWTIPTSGGIARDLVFTTYMQTGFVAAGDYVSSVKDSNPPFPNTFWSTLSWSATVPANTTLSFQVAGSDSFGGPFNFVGPDGTPASFYTSSPANITQFFGKRFLKYKAYLTGNSTTTPTLNDVTVCFNNPPTAAPADIGGQIVSADGSPLAGVVVRLSGGASLSTVTNAAGFYRFSHLGIGDFYTVTPELANYHFAPAERSFSLVGSRTDAVFTASADAQPTGNPIDSNEYFVRQQYLDFLGREPEPDGLAYWAGQLNACNGDAACQRTRRIDVSAAFFGSQEFYDTGSFVYRLYKGALGRQLTYEEFSIDRSQIVAGSDLEANKRAFANAFVTRAEFVQRYAGSTNANSFVDALLQTVRQETGVDLSDQRSALVARYLGGGSMNDSRARVMRDVVDNEAFGRSVYNASFVTMEYMGYLRRTAESGGYAFWLDVLNNGDAGNYRGMVCSFLTSAEYQRRFSVVVTRANSDCGQ